MALPHTMPSPDSTRMSTSAWARACASRAAARSPAAKARIVYGDCPENPKWRGLERITGAVLLVFGVLYSLSLFLVR